MSVTLGDFCPINSWTPQKTLLNKVGIGTPSDVVDGTTGRVFWNRSRWTVRCHCLALSTLGPVIQLIIVLVTDAKCLYRVVSLQHFRLHKPVGRWTQLKQACGLAPNEHWTRQAWRTTASDLCTIAKSPIVLVGLQLSALYGLVCPYDGRKLYASFERWMYERPMVAPTFHPDDLDNPRVSALERMSIILMIFPAIYGSIYLHELGHKVAMTSLYVDVDPKITVHSAGGFCTWGGDAKIPTPFGQNFTRDISRGIVFAAGPAVDLVNCIVTASLALMTRKKHPSMATFFSSLSVSYAWSSFKYSLSREAGHDYEQMSSLFSIPQPCFNVVTALYTGYSAYSYYHSTKRYLDVVSYTARARHAWQP